MEAADAGGSHGICVNILRQGDVQQLHPSGRPRPGWDPAAQTDTNKGRERPPVMTGSRERPLTSIIVFKEWL